MTKKSNRSLLTPPELKECVLGWWPGLPEKEADKIVQRVKRENPALFKNERKKT